MFLAAKCQGSDGNTKVRADFEKMGGLVAVRLQPLRKATHDLPMPIPGAIESLVAFLPSRDIRFRKSHYTTRSRFGLRTREFAISASVDAASPAVKAAQNSSVMLVVRLTINVAGKSLRTEKSTLPKGT